MDITPTSAANISINCPTWSEEERAGILSIYQSLSLRLIEASLWPQRITSVLVSQDYEGDFLRLRTEETDNITRGREARGISKIIYANEGGTLLIDGDQIEPISPDLRLVEGVFFAQLLTVTFSREWRELLAGVKWIDDSITQWVLQLLKVWLPSLESSERCLSLGVQRHNPYSRKIYLDEFKRCVKNAHMQYQASREDATPLTNSFMQALLDLVLRATEGYTHGESLEDLEEFSVPVIGIIDSIQAILDHKPKISNCYLANLRKSFVEILELCFMKISDIPDGSHTAVTTDPRLLFKGNFVETVPAIVGFTDILGFTKFVEHYDSTPTSNSIKELRDALSNSVARAQTALITVESIMEAFSTKKYTKHSELLEYRQFSDCLSLALPILDYPPQFMYEVMGICLTLSAYQFELMTKGYFIRGGIAVGQYYSDPNMIFSGALIDAYHIERDLAIHPRIVVSSEVAERLHRSDPSLIPGLSMQRAFVSSEEEPDITFLNPLFAHCSPLLNPFQSVSLEPIVLAFRRMAAEWAKYPHLVNDNVQAKYLWFLDFFLWYTGEESLNKFHYVFES